MDGNHQRDGERGVLARTLDDRHTSSPPAPAAAAKGGDRELALLVGANLRRLRTRRGYSLGRLGELSGVSRAMLGQIELGRSLPSIGLLWKIARALDVRFTAFTADTRAEGTTVVRATVGKLLVSQDGGFSSRALFPGEAHRRVEFYELRLAKGAREEAGGHAPGTVENLVVGSGSVEIDVADRRYRLGTGDAILFEADAPHTYRNPGEETAVMYLVMTYPDPPGTECQE